MQNSQVPSIHAKKAAGIAAAQLVENGMRVGLGTGSTAFFFIEALIQRFQQGLSLKGVIATSQSSHELAVKGKLPLFKPEEFTELDLVIDGADEIDHQKRMIKGGGGALLREKIAASCAKEMIVVIDESKVVERLKGPLPIEVSPFGCLATLKALNTLGLKGDFRHDSAGNFYVTDNQHYLIDLVFDKLLENPEEMDKKIKEIPGVLETGFFFHLAGRVVIGYQEGRAEICSSLPCLER